MSVQPIYPTRARRGACSYCGRTDVPLRRDPDSNGWLLRNHGAERSAHYGVPGIPGRELSGAPSCRGSAGHPASDITTDVTACE